MGYSGSKNDWDPTFLNKLSTNHTLIVFDNRGIGGSHGSKNFTMEQFAKDAVELLNALNISKADVLGYSMGGMIAQELTLRYPDKVDDLIIYASNCGDVDQTYMPPEILLKQFSNINGTNDDIKERFVPYQFPNDWIKQYHENYTQIFESFDLPSNKTLQKQQSAIGNWSDGGGSWDRLNEIYKETLIIAGTADKIIPSINSEILKDKINGSKVEIFVGGGHALMFQFPEKLSEVINRFLAK